MTAAKVREGKNVELRVLGKHGAHPEWKEVGEEDAEYGVKLLRELVKYVYILPYDRSQRRIKENSKKAWTRRTGEPFQRDDWNRLNKAVPFARLRPYRALSNATESFLCMRAACSAGSSPLSFEMPPWTVGQGSCYYC